MRLRVQAQMRDKKDRLEGAMEKCVGIGKLDQISEATSLTCEELSSHNADAHLSKKSP